MSLPAFSTQGELFSTAGLAGSLFAETDRYRLFAKLVYPHLVRARAKLETCYCADNGRVALEPVLLLGVSILQDLDGVPDRHAVERLRYHAGWNFALNRQFRARGADEPAGLCAGELAAGVAGTGRGGGGGGATGVLGGAVGAVRGKSVDGAYVSAQKLAPAQAEGREIMGPAQAAPRQEGRFSVEDFQVHVEQRQAVCPAGQSSRQCSRLAEEATGKVSYRFEWSTHCHECPQREPCLGKDQRHRTLVVGEHHTVLQARRQEQQTEAFQARMNQRNAIEGTQSESVRGHGLRHARYRGLAKARLQNYFIGAACNVKRWIRREAWRLRQAALAWAGPAVSPDAAVAAATPGN